MNPNIESFIGCDSSFEEANIVLFGALTHVLKLEQIDWEDVIRDTVPPKFLELNLQAYRAGLEAARKQ